MDDAARERDRSILILCHAGDPAGLGQLYAAHAAGVRAFLARMVGADADDLTHEVFLRAAAHVGKFRGEASLGWWLTRIANNCAARHVARARRQVPVPELEVRAETRSGPEERALEAEDRRDARQALERLPSEDRQILMLREISGLSYEEIRDRLRLRVVGTVKSRLHKAREALRRAWSLGQ